ncbi:class I DNA-(apurinic or apyrimidinic site) endonuclease, partial [Balamuthia mandrillaris]
GPSIRYWGRQAQVLVGRRVRSIEGNTKQVKRDLLIGRVLKQVWTHGKEFFLCFSLAPSSETGEQTSFSSSSPSCSSSSCSSTSSNTNTADVWLRLHFMLYGSVFVNCYREKPSSYSKTGKVAAPRFVCIFDTAREEEQQLLAVYQASITHLDAAPFDDHPTCIDVLSPDFDHQRALLAFMAYNKIESEDESKNNNKKGENAASILLFQTLFAGLGNIIKVEALFRARVHPGRRSLSQEEAKRLIQAGVDVSREWYEALLQEESFCRDMRQIYGCAYCPGGHKTKQGRFGPEDGLQRRTNWCPVCQPGDDEEQEEEEGEEEAKKATKTKERKKKQDNGNVLVKKEKKRKRKSETKITKKGEEACKKPRRASSLGSTARGKNKSKPEILVPIVVLD